jgi:hypothetical protein
LNLCILLVGSPDTALVCLFCTVHHSPHSPLQEQVSGA